MVRVGDGDRADGKAVVEVEVCSQALRAGNDVVACNKKIVAEVERRIARCGA